MTTNESLRISTEEKIAQGHKVLDVFKIDPKRLAVLAVGGEQIVGEIVNVFHSEDLAGSSLVGRPILMRNPKRLIRLQKMDQRSGALTIEFLLGDYDFIEEGVVEVQTSFGYWLEDISPQSQVGLLSLFVDFMNRRKAVDTGLILPEPGLVMPRPGAAGRG